MFFSPYGNGLKARNYKEALSDWYVKGCIRLPDECITPELIQLYRGVFN